MKVFKAFIKPFEPTQRANQLTGFYMRATLALNGLRSPIIYYHIRVPLTQPDFPLLFFYKPFYMQ